MFRNPCVFVLSFYRVHSPTPSARSLYRRFSSEIIRYDYLLLDKRDPRAELPADAVGKAAEVIARQVVLKVTRIEMIREIEDLKTEFHSIFIESSRQTNSPQNLQIERGEVRIASGKVSGTDKVALLIDD